jgi:hypothetical protein
LFNRDSVEVNFAADCIGLQNSNLEGGIFAGVWNCARCGSCLVIAGSGYLLTALEGETAAFFEAREQGERITFVVLSTIGGVIAVY